MVTDYSRADAIDRENISRLPSNQRPTKEEAMVARQIKQKIRERELLENYIYFSGKDEYENSDWPY